MNTENRTDESKVESLDAILSAIESVSNVYLSADDSAESRDAMEQARDALMQRANATGDAPTFILTEFEQSTRYVGDTVKQWQDVYEPLRRVVDATNRRNIAEQNGKLTNLGEQAIRLYKSCLASEINAIRDAFVATAIKSGDKQKAQSILDDTRFAKRIEHTIREKLGFESVKWTTPKSRKGSALQAEIAAKATIAKLFS